MGKKYIIDETTLTNMATSVREHLGVETKYRPEDMPTGIDSVYVVGVSDGEEVGFNDGFFVGQKEGYDEGHTEGYEAGKQAGNDAFWDVITRDGKRTRYSYAFSEWGGEAVRPPFKFTPTGEVNHLFIRCPNLKIIEKQYFDLSNITGDLSAFCNACSNLEVIEDINFRGEKGNNYYQSFSYCSNLHTIERLPFEETITTDSAFARCEKLQNITIDGVIGRNISFSYSPLTVESMLSVITHLKDYSETTNAGKYTLTLKDTCKTLMAEQGTIAELGGKTYDQYITDIGWNLA